MEAYVIKKAKLLKISTIKPATTTRTTTTTTAAATTTAATTTIKYTNTATACTSNSENSNFLTMISAMNLNYYFFLRETTRTFENCPGTLGMGKGVYLETSHIDFLLCMATSGEWSHRLSALYGHVR